MQGGQYEISEIHALISGSRAHMDVTHDVPAAQICELALTGRKPGSVFHIDELAILHHWGSSPVEHSDSL